MGKQWVRQEIKRNELQELVDGAAIWVSRNRGIAAAIAAGGVAVAVVAVMLFYRSQSRQNMAWDLLSMAEEAAYQGKTESALKQLKDLDSRFPGSKASGYGLIFTGDLLYPKGQYKEALQAYNKVVENGGPKAILPLALGDMVVTQEASGLCQQAVPTAQRFLESYGDHFMAPQVHSSLARCFLSLGQKDQARTAFQKITLQYPETSWALWAKKRLDAVPGARAQ